MGRWFERLIRIRRVLGHPCYRRDACRGTWRW